MQSLRIGNYVAQCVPTRDMGALSAALAKCNGKYKPSKIKTDKRYYPVFEPGCSTAEYVRRYHELNTTLRPYASAGSVVAARQAAAAADYFAPLNTEPCTLYSGADYCETIDDDNVVDFPQSLALAA